MRRSTSPEMPLNLYRLDHDRYPRNQTTRFAPDNPSMPQRYSFGEQERALLNASNRRVMTRYKKAARRNNRRQTRIAIPSKFRQPRPATRPRPTIHLAMPVLRRRGLRRIHLERRVARCPTDRLQTLRIPLKTTPFSLRRPAEPAEPGTDDGSLRRQRSDECIRLPSVAAVARADRLAHGDPGYTVSRAHDRPLATVPVRGLQHPSAYSRLPPSKFPPFDFPPARFLPCERCLSVS
jgi:hypothetical protein